MQPDPIPKATTMTTTRYALIDDHSGYVWGVVDATSPVEACRIVDADGGDEARVYEEHGSGYRLGGADGYLVHEAPVGFDVADGQDVAQIEAVSMLPRVAVVSFTVEG
jgi:hypothetical protein